MGSEHKDMERDSRDNVYSIYVLYSIQLPYSRYRVKPMTGGGLKWMPQIIQLFGSSSVNL